MQSSSHSDGLNEFVNEDQPHEQLVIIQDTADDGGGFDTSVEGAEYVLPGILEVISDTRMKVDLLDAIHMDLSNEPVPEPGDKTRYLKPIVAHTKISSEQIYKAFMQGKKVLSLGGNHVRGFGVLGALRACHEQKKKLGMVWVDAHPDGNTDKSTVTGHLHGTPAAFLLGQGGPKELLELLNNAPFIDPHDFIYIGLNAIDDPKNDDGSPRDQTELSILRELIEKGVKCFPMDAKMRKAKAKNVVPNKVKKAITELSNRLKKEGGKLWVEWDVDSVDVTDMPAAAMDNKNGLSAAQIHDLFNHIGSNCSVDGVGVSELVPAKDKDGKARQLVVEAVGHLFGVSNPNYSIHMDRSRKEMVNRQEQNVVTELAHPAAVSTRRKFTHALIGSSLAAGLAGIVTAVSQRSSVAEDSVKEKTPIDGIELTNAMGFMNFETNQSYREAWKLSDKNKDLLELFEGAFSEQVRRFPEACNAIRSAYQKGEITELDESMQRSLSWMLTFYHLARLRAMRPESTRTVDDIEMCAKNLIGDAYRQHREQGGKGRSTMADEGVSMFQGLYDDFTKRVEDSHWKEDAPDNPLNRLPDRSLQMSLEVNGYLPR